MNDNISVNNDPTSSTAVEFGDESSIDSLAKSTIAPDSSQVQVTDPFDAMQSVAAQLRGQIGSTDTAQNVLGNNISPTSAAEESGGASSSLLDDGFEARAKTFSDTQLESELKNKEALLTERQDQQRSAENTEDNADAIADTAGIGVGLVGLASGIPALGRAAARGVVGGLSFVTGGAISFRGTEVIEAVVGNSADVAVEESTRLGVEVQALKNEQARRAKLPPAPLSGREVTGPLPDRPDSGEPAESLPEQIATEREFAAAERDKQKQFENIAATDPAFRDQALTEAGISAQRADAAENRANELQARQDENVNALAAQEEQDAKVAAAAAEKQREEKRREQNDRSEPNGGQVSGADRGVGRNDTPDSF